MSYPVYTGIYYALEGLGGYDMEEGIHNVELIPSEILNQYDVTGSVQIYMDVRFFNQKIGLYETDILVHPDLIIEYNGFSHFYTNLP